MSSFDAAYAQFDGGLIDPQGLDGGASMVREKSVYYGKTVWRMQSFWVFGVVDIRYSPALDVLPV